MINSILEKHGLNTGLIGTVIVKMGSLIQPADLTTPKSLDLHRCFDQMVKQNVSHAIIEVSSSGLVLKRVGSVNLNTVVINNISSEHIDLHGSYEQYYKAKAYLVREAREGQWAVFNLDCPQTAPLVNETRAMTFTNGLKNKAADHSLIDFSLADSSFTF